MAPKAQIKIVSGEGFLVVSDKLCFMQGQAKAADGSKTILPA